MDITLKIDKTIANDNIDKLITSNTLIYDASANSIMYRIYTFDHTQMKTIKNLNGKYIKLLLSRLECRIELSKDMRKIILDTMNDYARELHEELGI